MGGTAISSSIQHLDQLGKCFRPTPSAPPPYEVRTREESDGCSIEPTSYDADVCKSGR